ncbi:MAG: serine hydrolase domain-containing protein [Pseudomonadota bacterium]
MKKTLASVILLMMSVNAYSDIHQKLQDVLDDFIARHPASPGIVAALDCDEIGLKWRGAAGFTTRERTAPLNADSPFRLASTTKTYVAATILRLIEQGKLGLDDAIDMHLSKDILDILRRDYAPEKMTIRQLLTHTAGLNDHTLDTNYVELVMADPQHHWTAIEQITLGVDKGSPIGSPGEQYRYSDTGYVLLGEIIEHRSGQVLAAALRKQLKFNELGLDATWLETVEPWPANLPPRPGQYLGELDTSEVHASVDLYGGGGLVATMEDVAHFYEALFEGKIFKGPNTLWLMRSSIVPDNNGPTFDGGVMGPVQYTLGLFSWSHAGHTVFQHSGAWGTIGGYVPNLVLAFGLTVGDGAISSQYPWVKKLLDIVIAAKAVSESSNNH